MRHIAITDFSGEICQGEIHKEPIPRKELTARFRLPVYPSLGTDSRPQIRWRCARCGKIWDREPLPQEAL